MMMRLFKYILLVLILMLLPLKHWGQAIRNGFIEVELASIANPDYRYCLFSVIAQDDNINYIVDEDNSSVLLASTDGWNDEQFQDYYEELKANAEREFEAYLASNKEKQGAFFARWKERLPQDLFVLLFRQIMIENPNNRDGNQTCATADPFCTTDVVTFHVDENVSGSCEAGPDYDCMESFTNRPPFWYYMKIGIGGTFTIQITNSNNLDLDFCAWGPFTDEITPCTDQLTSDKVIDCDSPYNSVQECTIPTSSQVGDYFLMVITKYSSGSTDITFQKVANSGPGETDCGILPGYALNDGPYCVGDDIHLSINEQEGATYSWSGPNGFSSSLREPTITNCTMADAGTYTCLVSVDTLSVTGTTEVVIYANPIAAFTFDEVCSGTPTHFTSTSTTNPSGQTISGYQWSFGDGGTSTQQNPTHTYAQGGTYQVTLTVNCGGICTDELTQTVTVNASPTVNAGPDQTIAYGSSTQLNGSAGTGNFTYQWSPENMINGASNIANPQTVALTATQTYTLTVTNPDHPECNGTDQVTIHINGSAMTVSASANPTTICAGSSTQLTANAGGGTGIFTYSWSPTTGLSNPGIQNPVASPSQTTTYTCTVNDGQTTQTATVTVTVVAAPTANFTYTTACEGAATQFTSTASGQDINDYQWDFGDGQSGSGQNVSHTYAQAGSYTVTHTVSTTAGGCTGSVTQNVPVNPLPSASFTYTSFCSGTPTQFNSTSTGQGITSYQWNFGDGQSGTGQNPSHTYAQAGNYQVTLTVGNGSGTCDDAITQAVTVNAPPEANFTFTTECQGTPTQFTSTSTGQGITNYQWSFGDGQTGSGQNVSHTYAQAGTYTVTHTVSTSNSGCDDQKTQSVTVGTMPVANAGQDQTINYGGTAQLSGSGGAGSFNFHWEPANKVVNANAQNTQTIALYDTQTFTLTVTNPQTQQCVDNSQVTIHIQGSAMTVTASPNASICQGGSTTIQANAGGGTGNFTYSWTPTTGLSNSHIYNPVASPMQTTTYTCSVSDGQTTQSVSTTVFVNDVIVEHEYMSICPGESYSWHGNSYSTIGTYEYNTTTPEGCEKTIYLHLDLYPEYDETIVNAAICDDELYYFNGNAYNATGQYPHTLQTIHGCDSIVTLNLTVWPENELTVKNISLCPEQLPFNFYGVDYYEEVDVTVWDTDIHGCDSAVRLVLTISDYYQPEPDVIYVCYQDSPSYTWPVNGITYTSEGHYTDTLPTAFCQGIYNLELHFQQEPPIKDTTIEVCNSYYWSETQQTYYSSGTYTHSVSLDPYPCEQVQRLHLIVNHESVSNSIEAIDSCNVVRWPYGWNGEVYSFHNDTVVTKTISTADGCDSITTLTIRNMRYSPVPVIRCSDQSIEFPNHPITATEFNVNRYTYYASDPKSDATWINDSCQWSISKPSWRIEPSDDNRSCTVYAMDWVPDTIWLSFKAVNHCNDTVVRYGLVPSFYGIEETEAYPAAVSVMPNPNNGKMQLRFENMEGRIGIQVYTLTGALIDSFEVTTTQVGDTFEYSMKRFQNGVYFFVISDGKRSVTKKVVIIW